MVIDFHSHNFPASLAARAIEVMCGKLAAMNEQMGGWKYKLEDSYGAPQAGCDIKYFSEWYELEEYLEDNPDVEERISEGYATIKERY